MARRRGVNYHNLNDDSTDGIQSKFCREDSFTAAQFEKPPQKIPWANILFITLLFIFGLVFLVLSFFLYFELFESKEYHDRAAPLFILGLLTFTPGAYYFWIIVCVVLRVPNYSFDDIPQFNN